MTESFNPTPNKKEKISREERFETFAQRAIMTGIIASSVACGLWMAKEFKKDKDRERARQELADFREKIRSFDLNKEAELYKEFGLMKQSCESDPSALFAENEYYPNDLEYDLRELDDLERGALKRELNIDTEGKTEQEITGIYQKYIDQIKKVREARKRLKELHFHKTNDPRIMMVEGAVLDSMSIPDEEKRKALKKPLRIDIMEVSKEAVPGQEGFDSDTGTNLSSVELVRLLDIKDPKHIDGLCTASHELTHRRRREELGSMEAYEKVYDQAAGYGELPPGYISDTDLPPKIREFDDLWLRKIYIHDDTPGAHPISGTGLQEREAMTVSALVAISAFKNGEVIRVNPKNKELLRSISTSNQER